MLCCPKTKNIQRRHAEKDSTIQPFHKTFRVVSFALGAGLMYPNPSNETFRFVGLALVFASVLPMLAMILVDVYDSWQQGDIPNIIRHCTIVLPFFVTLIKMYLMNHYRVLMKQIIDGIDRDHSRFNALPDRRRRLVDTHLAENKFMEKRWLVLVLNVCLIFPAMATAQTLYNYTTKTDPKKYMIHDLNMPFQPPEVRFQSPYYEIIYVYMLYCCIIYMLSFIGYDGFFGIAINHACVKMNLYCMELNEALANRDEKIMYRKIVEVIRAQCDVYDYVDTLQRTFNFWLGMIFVCTIVHICNCMYQIMEGMGMDVRYLIFIIGSVIHIYLPCSYASKLKHTSSETATLFYCSGWERAPAQAQLVRQMLVFMIARAQIPTKITAFNIVTFDMELFVSILHTSYSMFTLLRSKD